MKTGFITMEYIENRVENSVGSSRIRARWVADKWEDAELYRMGEKYDVLIFQKAYWQFMLSNFKGKKIFDICDPDWLDPRPVVEAISHCDAVTCSTDALNKYLSKLTDKPVVTIPDRINFDIPRKIKKHNDGRAKTIVWFGYAHNAQYIERALPVIAKLGLKLTIICEKGRSPLFKYAYENVWEKKDYNVKTINEDVIQADFALMPKYPTTIDRDGRLKYKSNNKTVQCWAWGMPVAHTPEDIERLLDPDVRKAEAEESLLEAEQQYNVKKSVEDYKKLISSL